MAMSGRRPSGTQSPSAGAVLIYKLLYKRYKRSIENKRFRVPSQPALSALLTYLTTLHNLFGECDDFFLDPLMCASGPQVALPG